uniref:Transposase n=1 Tax=Steinernema glaseri TaxID=37863 RepID=A0A1I8A8E2_9BILA
MTKRTTYSPAHTTKGGNQILDISVNSHPEVVFGLLKNVNFTKSHVHDADNKAAEPRALYKSRERVKIAQQQQ